MQIITHKLFYNKFKKGLRDILQNQTLFTKARKNVSTFLEKSYSKHFFKHQRKKLFKGLIQKININPTLTLISNIV